MPEKIEGQSEGAGSGTPALGGTPPEVLEALGAPIDTGASVPRGENPLAQSPPAAPASEPKAAPATPAAPAPSTIPEPRFKQVLGERNDLRTQLGQVRVQAATNQQAADVLAEINANPDTRRILEDHYAGRSSAVQPGSAPVSGESFEDNPVAAVQAIVADQLKQHRAENARQMQQQAATFQQGQQQLMGVLAPLVEDQAATQRAQLQKAYPDYDPPSDDPEITQMMQAHNLTLLNAYTLIRSQRGLPIGTTGVVQTPGAGEGPSAVVPDPGQVVLPPSPTPPEAGLTEKTQQLFNRAAVSGSEADLLAALEHSAVESGETGRFARGEAD